MKKSSISRRTAIQSVLGVAGTAITALPQSSYASSPGQFRDYGKVKITKLETFLVKPRWIFLKIHTDVGVVGLGEPLLEGRALTIQTAIKEVDPYLIGKDPRHIIHHWQAIYRHAFYRGVPNFLVQEQVSLGEGYLKKPFKLEKDGTVLIPSGPGLGVELDEAQLKDKIGHDWKTRKPTMRWTAPLSTGN